MLKTRIIPCLQLANDSLVKTIKYNKANYIGDPINTVRIFNELKVDELVFVDITATKNVTEPNYKILHQIADECFMPLSYGGGIKSLDDAKRILTLGFEKIIINTGVFLKPQLISEIATHFGSQAVVVAIDVKKNFWGKYEVYSTSGSKKEKIELIELVKTTEQLGAGEILLTSINQEGTWCGFDIELISTVSESTSLPVIAHGGAGSIDDIRKAVHEGKASAVALGSMVVYQSKGMGVLVNFPDRKQLEKALA